MKVLTAACVVAMLSGAVAPTQAQSSETLADIRQQLSVLYVDIQRLKQELSTTGGVAGNAASGTTLQRVDAIEAQLQRLTAKTEQLEFRVDSVVRDGTNRVGDLEFRLCELEPNCDIGTLGDTPTLGGGQIAAPAVAVPQTQTPGAEFAVGEQADFDRAMASLNAGDYQSAAEQFQVFAVTYPGGPLSSEAHYHRGDALSQLGQTADSARAFLESFSGAPNGALAPNALYRLGMSLKDLGQTQEACVTLGEVGARFPDASITFDARAAMTTLGCS